MRGLTGRRLLGWLEPRESVLRATSHAVWLIFPEPCWSGLSVMVHGGTRRYGSGPWWSGPGQDMVLSVIQPLKFLANLVILAERLRTAAALGELFRPSDHRLIFFISFDTSPCHWHTLTHGEP
jgi:hypothetical protein